MTDPQSERAVVVVQQTTDRQAVGDREVSQSIGGGTELETGAGAAARILDEGAGSIGLDPCDDHIFSDEAAQVTDVPCVEHCRGTAVPRRIGAQLGRGAQGEQPSPLTPSRIAAVSQGSQTATGSTELAARCLDVSSIAAV